VSVDGSPPAQRYQLVVADADGVNARVILESRQPVMSPAWSPDGQWLAYVSFENKRASIYVQQVSSGERRLVSGRVGINGAPAWSPDGHRLLVTLGGSGGIPNLYILDLATQQLTRLTDGPAIDTEGAWAADGKSVYFTSDRSGGPQIYRVGVEPGARPRRVTFGGSYNARPRLSPDGTQLALVTLDGANYRIAVQDLASGTVRILSHGRLDASPSFAPNGAMIIFSGIEGGHSTLQRVSVDGQTSQRLRADSADVREPVWAPFTPQ
jgi:TolB protein